MVHIRFRQIDITSIPTNIGFPDIFNHGSTSAHSVFRGRPYEVTFDSSKNTLVTHNGSGGQFPVLKENQSNLPSGGVNNGMIVPSTNTLSLVTGGDQQLTILPNGNVGIGTSSPEVKLQIIGTDAIQIPVGDSSERPFTPQPGMVRYLTPDNVLEYSNGSIWIPIVGGEIIRMGPLIWVDGTVNSYTNPLGTKPKHVNLTLQATATPITGFDPGEEQMIPPGFYNSLSVGLSYTSSDIDLALQGSVPYIPKPAGPPAGALLANWELYMTLFF